MSASVAGEEGLMSCVLPEELLVEILAERLQVGASGRDFCNLLMLNNILDSPMHYFHCEEVFSGISHLLFVDHLLNHCHNFCAVVKFV